MSTKSLFILVSNMAKSVSFGPKMTLIVKQKGYSIDILFSRLSLCTYTYTIGVAFFSLLTLHLYLPAIITDVLIALHFCCLVSL